MREPDISDAQLRQMMLGLERPGPPGQSPLPNNPSNMPPPPNMEEMDPLMKMMSQMMSGAGMGGAAGDGSSPFPGFPSMPGAAPQQQPQLPPDPYTSLWRLLHALVAIGLGAYVALLTTFAGTRHAREREAIAYDPLADANEHHRRNFFWVFATAETLLLTTRFFLDRQRAPPPGLMYTVIGYLPQPYKGNVEVVLRYGRIASTVRADILCCIFVLGVCAWWKS